jgi:hypothetical protein
MIHTFFLRVLIVNGKITFWRSKRFYGNKIKTSLRKNTEVCDLHLSGSIYQGCDADYQLPKTGTFYHEVNLQVDKSEIFLTPSSK